MNATTELSKGFFQKFHEHTVPPGFQPVLQVLETRAMTGNATSFRVRLSDGIFSYSTCALAAPLGDRFLADGLTEGNGIIRVTECKTSEGTKRSFIIMDYELLDINSPVIGQPQAHSGNPQDYAGIENHQLAPNRAVKRGTSPDANQPLRKRQPSGNIPQYDKTDISLITPYINKWRICGIISAKENIKDIKNARGAFRVFSFTVTDKEGYAIRVSAFGEQAEKFHPLIENDKAYYISGGGGGSVRAANKQWNSTGHDYELTLSRESDVVPCTDITMSQTKFKINAIPLQNIAQHISECVDVVGIVERVSEVTQVTARADQRQLNKRDIYIVDDSAIEACLTLWGDHALEFDASNVGEVVAFKGVVVKEFGGGITLSSVSGTVIKNNPGGVAASRISGWNTDRKVSGAEIKSISSTFADGGASSFERELRLIGIAVQHHIGRDTDRGAYFNVKAMISSVRSENAIYQGCPTEGCKKKLTGDAGQYRCEKCNRTFDTCKNILMLSVELADFSGTAWATIFEEQATKLLNLDSEHLAQLQKEDASAYTEILEGLRFRHYNIRVRVKYDMFNDQQQMRWTIYDMKPVPHERCMSLYSEAIEKCESI
ncbi:replication protein A OB domain-containing protein [Ditylenchus destructor]|uniref:Replication protein A subunit n=1 Tax=Ditylenchus destructor TaxID=166010 RepID=A0AAD4R860_9BILA|nr:replication protein A OB domain-containing protein [Ditylenchus destructor]